MHVFKTNSNMAIALSLLGVIVGSFVVSDVLNGMGLKEGMENEEEIVESELDAEEPAEENVEESSKECMGCDKEGMENKKDNNKKVEKIIEPSVASSTLNIATF